MKVAPLIRLLANHRRFRPFLVHTGQHYDAAMSNEHFRDLGLPSPDANLGVGSGSQAEQTGLVMERIEQILEARKPRLVVVVGDVNSTLGASLAAAKLGIEVAHVEAGLRSFDRSMPEEINRILTDHLSAHLFTHSREADANLRKEGLAGRRIAFVGNVMIDTLDRMLPRALRFPPISNEPYGLITLHRPDNVDDPATLRGFLTAFARISAFLPLYFPVHPRTAARLKKLSAAVHRPRVRFLEPLPYLRFLGVMARARLVLTDSGGIQEETTALGIPCLTLRKNSERMVTVSQGTNVLAGRVPDAIVSAARRVLKRSPLKRSVRPELWDGRAAERILRHLELWLSL
jgi:UDP-N-acetylglucosamine 2-epimerase (non-hydrolysing)